MSTMHGPLLLEPRLLAKPWGGHRLAALRGEPAGGEAVGESWEMYKENSPVMTAYALPLLLKFIDATQNLSVQVHPDDALARRLHGPQALGKSEMWVVVKAAPGAKIWSGFKPGVQADHLEMAIQAGTLESSLNEISVQEGDVFDIPAGRVHAIGAGCLVAEIQQESDYTYRLWDWGRRVNGVPRELHLFEAASALRWDSPFVSNDGRILPQAQETEWGSREALLKGPYFQVERWTLRRPGQSEAGPATACMVLKGSLRVGDLNVGPGRTALVPIHTALSLVPGPQGAVVLWIGL